MFSKTILGLGAILDGILIAATYYFGWPGYLYYIWALLAVVWGVLIFLQK